MMDSIQAHLLLSVHSWLVRDRDRTILIDTGAGNGKDRPDAPYFDHLDTLYLQQLRATGCEPEDIDYILLTHLHVDHVGWNTRLENGRWVPTFSNARYIFARCNTTAWIEIEPSKLLLTVKLIRLKSFWFDR
jgi:glyoxylase-like metal-dependent hydrolase (beta-lactamase superfamily II)